MEENKIIQFAKKNILYILVILLIIALIIVPLFDKTNKPQLTIEIEKFEGKPKILLYYASWCGYSRSFLPEWDKFYNKHKDKLDIVMVKCENGTERKCYMDGVTGYPTVIYYSDKGNETYNGERTAEALEAFVLDKLK